MLEPGRGTAASLAEAGCRDSVLDLRVGVPLLAYHREVGTGAIEHFLKPQNRQPVSRLPSLSLGDPRWQKEQNRLRSLRAPIESTKTHGRSAG